MFRDYLGCFKQYPCAHEKNSLKQRLPCEFQRRAERKKRGKEGQRERKRHREEMQEKREEGLGGKKGEREIKTETVSQGKVD